MNQNERDELVGLASELMSIAGSLPRLDESTVDIQRIAGDLLSIAKHKRAKAEQTTLEG